MISGHGGCHDWGPGYFNPSFLLEVARARDLTARRAPVRVDIGARLLDSGGRVLSGSAPMQIKLIDPLGVTRYKPFRATRQGTLTLSLPLAANDPAGPWRAVVREMLSGKEETARFGYRPTRRCGSLAGAAWRAVHFAPDRGAIHRFARVHQRVTIVKGSSGCNDAAAQRRGSGRGRCPCSHSRSAHAVRRS